MARSQLRGSIDLRWISTPIRPKSHTIHGCRSLANSPQQALPRGSYGDNVFVNIPFARGRQFGLCVRFSRAQGATTSVAHRAK